MTVENQARSEEGGEQHEERLTVVQMEEEEEEPSDGEKQSVTRAEPSKRPELFEEEEEETPPTTVADASKTSTQEQAQPEKSQPEEEGEQPKKSQSEGEVKQVADKAQEQLEELKRILGMGGDPALVPHGHDDDDDDMSAGGSKLAEAFSKRVQMEGDPVAGHDVDPDILKDIKTLKESFPEGGTYDAHSGSGFREEPEETARFHKKLEEITRKLESRDVMDTSKIVTGAGTGGGTAYEEVQMRQEEEADNRIAGIGGGKVPREEILGREEGDGESERKGSIQGAGGEQLAGNGETARNDGEPREPEATTKDIPSDGLTTNYESHKETVENKDRAEEGDGQPAKKEAEG
jgi:hypothetical protein